jgi:hypothetical protein
MNITRQKANKEWQDEAGHSIIYKDLKKTEKVNEKNTYDIAIAALKVHKSLKKLRGFIEQKVGECVAVFHKDYKGKRTEFKGNYTLFNFNRSIKIEVSVSNPIKFDDLTITKAKETLKEFLNDGVQAKEHAIKQMILDAFETSRGKLDVDKIMSLKRYSDRIDDKRWRAAMKLIDQAIRKPYTAIYYKVSVRNERGQYEYIKLDLAHV